MATFRGKYGYLPGDMTAAAAQQFGFTVGTGCAGIQGERDGDGLIDVGAPFLVAQGFDETALFWQDLSAANLIEGSFAAACNGISSSVSGTALNGYFPQASIGNGNYVYVYETNGANWFGVTAITGIQIGGAVSSATTMTVSQAYSIDTKIDDGLPWSGNVNTARICCTNAAIWSAPV